MNRIIVKLFLDQKGQALVEMVLILPILIMLIFGITEFGRMFSTDLVLTHSAREGARQAAVGATDTEIIAKIQNSAAIIDTSKMTISISPVEAYRQRGESVTVKLEYPVNIYAPIISNIVGDPYVASGEAVMRVE